MTEKELADAPFMIKVVYRGWFNREAFKRKVYLMGAKAHPIAFGVGG